MNKILIALTTGWLFFSTQTVFAEEKTDTSTASLIQRVSIDADIQQADIKRNILIFIKNVEVKHGSSQIKAERLEAHKREQLGKNKQLLIAMGNPAVLSEQLEDGQQIKAEANEIRYDVDKGLFTIKGDAKIYQGSQKTEAETITYDKNNKIITAEKAKNSEQRTRTQLLIDNVVDANLPENNNEASDSDE